MSKKMPAVIAAITAASAILCSTVCASVEYTADDLVQLRNSVLGADKVSSSNDINGDNTVDSLDLCYLRSLLADSGEYKVQSFAATAENVKLMGRTIRKNDVTWLVQSGSAAEFTITGKSAEITVAGDSSINNDEKYRSRYAVFVDDELVTDEIMSTEEKKISLFDGDTSRTAKVKVIHLSEAMNGAVGIKDITVDSSAVKPVVPAGKKDLKIEFIGDSITCAYGVEGKDAYESFTTATENFMKSYAYLTAKQLDADYSAVSYSGHGIISGYTSGEKNTDSLVPDCYGLVSKLSDYAVDWDFEAEEAPDVVVINLGTNDYSYLSSDLETRSPEFVEGYVDFLKMVREKNPDAYIICTMGTMGGAEVYDLIEQAVAQFSEETGESRIMSYESVVQNQADGIGSDWHPSEVTQQNSAYVLADKICQALGMESDQIGLNVAADSPYELVTDAEKGGNAAEYVSDYDKSFWINVVSGGTGADAIEARISGIGLKKGGKYRLEFDYTSTVDVTIPLKIEGTGEYYSDEINAVSEKLHYSEELTIPENDSDAAIVFQLGGMDYFNLTLYNIKLVKIA